jgi:hypothetical protein
MGSAGFGQYRVSAVLVQGLPVRVVLQCCCKAGVNESNEV